MPADSPTFPENRFAESRSPDPHDDGSRSQSEDVDHLRKNHDSEVLKKPRRFSRKDVEQKIAPDPDPDDPVSP
jgi:hypothetical protein